MYVGPVQVISEVVKSTWVNYLVLLGLLSTHGATWALLCLSSTGHAPFFLSPSVTLSALSSLGNRNQYAMFVTRIVFFLAFLMHLVSGLKIPCPRFHCSWHKLMDFQIKICQYILASRRSKNLRQIKNLCNKYLADHSKQVLTPPLNSLINRVESCYL